MFADHATSEKAVEVEAKGRRVIEWKEPPGAENDYFDCIVGCCVAASMQGVSLREMKGAALARLRVRLSDLQKQRRGQLPATPTRGRAASRSTMTAGNCRPTRRHRGSGTERQRRRPAAADPALGSAEQKRMNRMAELEDTIRENAQGPKRPAATAAAWSSIRSGADRG
jgi:hypothetical protein